MVDTINNISSYWLLHINAALNIFLNYYNAFNYGYTKSYKQRYAKTQKIKESTKSHILY